MAYTDKLRVVYGDYTLGVHGEGFDYIFSYAQGGLESIVKNGYEWLYRCPKPTFWRALTDNDRGSKFHIKSGSWLSADMFIDCKGIQVIMDGKEQKPYAPDNNSYGGDVYADEIIVKYTYETITTPATTVLVSYSVDASGKIRVDVHYNGVQGLPEFPVFGMRFIMPTLADKYLYNGLSGETYPDRKAGAQEGIYEIGDLSLTQYLVPQECGMRMDTECLKLQDIRLLITAGQIARHRHCALKRMMKNLHFLVCLIPHLRLKTLFTMKNCHRQEELFYAYMAQ